jgi:rhamnosyltransferase
MRALLRQSRPLQEIVVVDNASTDGTSSMLAREFPQVTLLRLDENLGIGGGLASGLQYAAIQKRYDWVWTFDQDSIPSNDALELLLAGADSLESSKEPTGIIAALPIHPPTGECYPPLLWRDGFVKPSLAQMSEAIWFADLVISSGCMVHRDLVQNIGLPRADFFIDFVDFEYCLRARLKGYKIAVVSGAKFAHEIGASRKLQFLGYTSLWPIQPPFREYYMTRNLAYAAWWLYPNQGTKRFVMRHLIRHAGGVLLFSSRKLACLRKMAQGFSDGRKASLGIRFRPTERTG